MGGRSKPGGGRMSGTSEPWRVVVTGAAGGLGMALVRAFAAAGHRVAAGWHRRSLEGWPGGVWALPLDVTSAAGVAAAFAEVERRWGGVDVLVNNAGVTRDGPVWSMRPEDWDAVIGVNLTGAWRCAREAGRLMGRQGGGCLLQVASHVGLAGAAGQANYAASKAGLIGLTLALARELGPHGIRVNAVLPGALATGMTRGLDEAAWARWRAANVLGRTGRLEAVARQIVAIAAMEDVSGQVFALDSRPLRPW
ncbi:MAG: SDR family oxidoreductase [Verrucomicrobia bacterium]|nr:MAG: SDR family oxidoreductase [Verrucomicrobiota bacterium]